MLGGKSLFSLQISPQYKKANAETAMDAPSRLFSYLSFQSRHICPWMSLSTVARVLLHQLATEKMSHKHAYGPIFEGIFSVEVPSSQVCQVDNQDYSSHWLTLKVNFFTTTTLLYLLQIGMGYSYLNMKTGIAWELQQLNIVAMCHIQWDPKQER